MTNDEFLSRYVFRELTEDVLAECEHFSCGVSDLDEYFQKDVVAYSRRMVSRSYVFCPKECPQKIACAFSVQTDLPFRRICNPSAANICICDAQR